MEQRLQTRIEIWTERLALVDLALQGELEKGCFSRSMDYLLFLDREKRICTKVISELRALADDADSGSYLEPRMSTAGASANDSVSNTL